MDEFYIMKWHRGDLEIVIISEVCMTDHQMLPAGIILKRIETGMFT